MEGIVYGHTGLYCKLGSTIGGGGGGGGRKFPSLELYCIVVGFWYLRIFVMLILVNICDEHGNGILNIICKVIREYVKEKGKKCHECETGLLL